VSNRDRPIAPNRPEDDLDRALNDWVQGYPSSLANFDKGTSDAVSQLYGWAQESDLPSYAHTILSPVSLPRRVIDRRLLVTITSLAAAVILGAVMYGSVTRLLDNTRERDDDVVVETIMAAIGTSPVSETHLEPLAAHDCAESPREPESVLVILGTPPAEGAWMQSTESAVAPIVVEQLNETLRGWQACNVYGNTFGAMAYESDQFIREDVYGSSEILDSYSESTLTEMLDAKVKVDATLAESTAGTQVDLLVIDPNREVTISVSGELIEAWIVELSPVTGQAEDQPSRMVFELQDGRWLIRDTELEFFRN